MSRIESHDTEQALGLDTKLLRGAVEGRLFQHPAPQTELGRFVVIERLGQGGMGVVYSAYDPNLDRRVAVKVLHKTVAEHGASAHRRLEREGRAMAKLSHPNVVTVHEVGTHEGRVFLAMEFVDGGTLVDWCKQHPPKDGARFRDALGLMRQVGEGLAAAHDAGLVHRDLKPHNVLIGPGHSRAMVGDFGLARLGEPAPPSDTTMSRDSVERDPATTMDSEAHLTHPGAAVGTPAYMAPEQFDGLADERSDQWALCATFFEVFYGVRPFSINSEGVPSQCVEDGPIEAPDRQSVPGWMKRALVRGLARDPKARFANVRALLDEISKHTRPRLRPLIAGGAIVGVAGVVLLPSLWGSGLLAPMTPCDDGAAKLEPALGAARKGEIRASFERTGEPYWAGAWERVEARLDAYAAQWQAAHADACEATQIRRVQTEQTWRLRTLCLDHLLEGLQVTSDAFANATANTVAHATRLSLALPSPAECSDPDRLTFSGGALSLADPRVAEVTTSLRRAFALGELGRNDEANAELDRAEPNAEALGSPVLQGEVYLLQSQLALRSGDWEQAEARALDALGLAEGAGHIEAMALAWNRLSNVAQRTDRHEAAAFRADRALALAEGGGLDAGRRGQILATKASALKGVASIETVIALREQALTQLRAHGAASTIVTTVSIDLVGDLAVAGQTTRALEVGEQTLVDADAIWSENHPNRVALLGQLAQPLWQAGQHGQALALLDRAQALFPDDMSWNIEERMALISMKAGILGRTSRRSEAITVLEDLLRETHGLIADDHPEVRGAHLMLAAMLLETGAPEQAAAELESMGDYGLDERVYPINRGAYWGNLAEAQVRSGQIDDALRSLERSQALYRDGSGAQSTWMFASASSAGTVYELAGRRERAAAEYGRALEIAAVTDVDASELAQARFGLARTLPRRQHARALDLASSARAHFAALGSAAAAELAEVDDWLQTRR